MFIGYLVEILNWGCALFMVPISFVGQRVSAPRLVFRRDRQFRPGRQERGPGSGERHDNETRVRRPECFVHALECFGPQKSSVRHAIGRRTDKLQRHTTRNI